MSATLHRIKEKSELNNFKLWLNGPAFQDYEGDARLDDKNKEKDVVWDFIASDFAPDFWPHFFAKDEIVDIDNGKKKPYKRISVE